jgi:hypothetical protein
MYHPAYHATAKPDINVYVKSPLFKVGSALLTNEYICIKNNNLILAI